MPARVRAFDWASTQLGALSTWPASLRTIVEVVAAAPWPMLVWWGEGAIQIHNDAARRALPAAQHPHALGAPAAEVWGGAWAELGAAAANVRAGGGSAVIERLALDERQTWSFALGPIPDGRGGIGGVLVSARRTAGEASFLETYREYLRTLFLCSPAPMAILRGPRYIVDVANKAIVDAYGLRLRDVLGRPAFDVVPEARERFEPLLERVRATGHADVMKELQYRTEMTADGRHLGRYANALFTPLLDVRGAVEGVLVIAVEITDVVRARDEMERLRHVAEAANRAKDEFLAILGHELRNPLSPIATTLQVMRMRGTAGRELDVLERQVGHLTRLVDDLLDVSRAMGGKIELHRRDLELAEVVSQALEVSSPLLELRHHLVDVDVPRHGLCVHVDRERMVQVVSNLLTNAAKYSEPGSRISILGTRTNDTIRLSVRDRGVGIAPDMLARVFEPFVQQAQTRDRARGGLGLGLAIVRSLVRLHGGKVAAFSEGVGRGSEFVIELPARDHLQPPPPEAVGPEVAGPPSPAARGKILVVDDNEDAATMLGDALEHLGYQVAVAYDGPSALRISAQFTPDVALLDLGLPVMDGYELARQMREQLPPDHLPHLVAVTGYGQEADRQRTVHAGFERHLVKPIDLGVLSGVVAELVAEA